MGEQFKALSQVQVERMPNSEHTYFSKVFPNSLTNETNQQNNGNYVLHKCGDKIKKHDQ